MSQKKKLLSYEDKSQSSKTTYLSFHDKIIKSGKTIPIIKRMNLKQFNATFMPLGAKRIKKNVNLAGKKRLLTQIQRDINKVSTDYIVKENITNDNYKTFLYNEAHRLYKTKDEEITKVNELEFEKIQKKGQYGVIKVVDLKDEHEYFIKYTDDKSLKKRLDDLKQQYRISNYITKFLGVYMYKTFITDEFKERLKKLKVA